MIAAAQARDPHARNLGDVVALLDDAAQRETLRGLEHALYRDGDASVALVALRGAFADGPRWRSSGASKHDDDGSLPPLYPER